MEPKVSCQEFVIRSHANMPLSYLSKLLDSFGAIVELPGHPGLFLAKLNKAAGSARQGWELIRSRLDNTCDVFPVFIDDDETLKYSTGTLQVRFSTSPTDRELEEWLPTGLRIASRNEYVPSQVAVESATNSKEFLPDVLASLERTSSKSVRIWPETIQQFKRH
jgi:hypothetical protein